MDVGAIVREARSRSGLSQEQLARRAGLSRAMVAMIERGRRSPSLATLTGLLAASGLQLKVELETLDDDVRRTVDDAARDGERPARVADLWSRFEGLPGVVHQVEGLAAAALLGLSVPIDVCEIAVADAARTYAWLTENLRARETFFLKPPRRDVAMWVGSEAHLREVLDEECDEGWFWLTHLFDSVRVRLAPEEQLRNRVLVSTVHGAIPVQPLAELSATDPESDRLLRVARRDRAES